MPPQLTARCSTRLVRWIAVSGLLMLIHAASIWYFGVKGDGPRISVSILLAEGIACAAACYAAVKRSGPVGRYFWRLMTGSWVLWIIAQITASLAPQGVLADLLFQFSTLPLGMTLFLEPDHELERFDPLHWADLIQALLFWITIYVYFTPPGVAPTVYGPLWNRSMLIDGLLIVSFLLRGGFTNSSTIRSLFLRTSIYCLASGAADTYGSVPPIPKDGDWFDLVWGSVIIVALLTAAIWDRKEEPAAPVEGVRWRHTAFQQLFPLLYPALTIALLGRVANYSAKLAALIGVSSFICFSCRLLVTQSRLRMGEIRLRKAVHETEAANRAKSEFLANMSHEIRTPMNGILGMTDLLLSGQPTSEQREYLEMSRTSGQALLTIINDILDFSKIEAGRLDLDPIAFNLRTLLEQTMKPLQLRGQEKNLLVQLEIQTEVPQRVCADPVRLQQVLINLVGNAIKFTARGAVTLRVGAGSAAERGVPLLFAVHDTGIGVPPEKQKSIFEAFAQADGSTSRRFGGTGLGLSISARLVEKMGGRIELSSALEGGSCFQFQIFVPLAAPLPAEKAGVEKTEQASTIGRRLDILLAEDNPINERLAVRLLEKHGHSVVTAKNGREAVERAKIHEFDVILMDVSMPEIDGLEATALIRANCTGKRRVPIVAMTAHALIGDREVCLRAGMDGYVTKPIQAVDVLRAIEEVLADREAQPFENSEAECTLSR